MICTQCQAENREGDRFCEQCGASLPEPSNGATLLAAPAADGVLVPVEISRGEKRELGNRATVGRMGTCDVPVPDKSVSREHARLSRLRDGYVLEDLNSTNGTMVNGKRIDGPTLLSAGDIVTFGSVEFRYEVVGAPQVEQPSGPPQPAAAAPTAAAPEEEGASMNDLPPVPVTFPPLEPFAPMPEEEGTFDPTATHAQPIVEEPGPPADVKQSETPVILEQPQPPAPPEVAAAASPPEVPPVLEDATPAAAPAGPPAPGPALQPVSDVPTTEPSQAAPGASELGKEAVATVRRLGDLIDTLFARLGESETGQAQLRSRISELEQAEKRQSGLRSLVRGIPEASVSRGQMETLQSMLDSLIADPRDIDILRQIGQQATDLAAVVNECVQLRQVTDRLAAALGSETGA